LPPVTTATLPFKSNSSPFDITTPIASPEDQFRAHNYV
jgi:hypothetical protein